MTEEKNNLLRFVRWDGLPPPKAKRGEPCIQHDRRQVRRTGEDLSAIWWQGRQWAVTSYGVEARDGSYPIEAKRLRELEDGNWSWPQQIAGKNWADVEDFATAWIIAVALHSKRGRELRDIISRLPPVAAEEDRNGTED